MIRESTGVGALCQFIEASPVPQTARLKVLAEDLEFKFRANVSRRWVSGGGRGNSYLALFWVSLTVQECHNRRMHSMSM